jgi:flagellar hook-basal body complex protein FliE
MLTSPISPALAAYSRAVERAAGATEEAASMPSFGSLLQGAMEGAVTAGRTAESASMGALAGNVSAQQLVEAVTAAELSLEAVTAVRDRVISAYQEVIRMPI